MTEEELARHNSKTLLQLLLSADARCDALTAERDRMREALQQFLIEYDEVDLADAEPSSLTEAVLAARAALKGETP